MNQSLLLKFTIAFLLLIGLILLYRRVNAVDLSDSEIESAINNSNRITISRNLNAVLINDKVILIRQKHFKDGLDKSPVRLETQFLHSSIRTTKDFYFQDHRLKLDLMSAYRSFEISRFEIDIADASQISISSTVDDKKNKWFRMLWIVDKTLYTVLKKGVSRDLCFGVEAVQDNADLFFFARAPASDSLFWSLHGDVKLNRLFENRFLLPDSSVFRNFVVTQTSLGSADPVSLTLTDHHNSCEQLLNKDSVCSGPNPQSKLTTVWKDSNFTAEVSDEKNITLFMLNDSIRSVYINTYTNVTQTQTSARNVMRIKTKSYSWSAGNNANENTICFSAGPDDNVFNIGLEGPGIHWEKQIPFFPVPVVADHTLDSVWQYGNRLISMNKPRVGRVFLFHGQMFFFFEQGSQFDLSKHSFLHLYPNDTTVLDPALRKNGYTHFPLLAKDHLRRTAENSKYSEWYILQFKLPVYKFYAWRFGQFEIENGLDRRLWENYFFEPR